jgi:hypothetical protein
MNSGPAKPRAPLTVLSLQQKYLEHAHLQDEYSIAAGLWASLGTLAQIPRLVVIYHSWAVSNRIRICLRPC